MSPGTTEVPNATASPSTTSYIFSVNHNASPGPAAAEYLEQQCSNYGGLAVVPYFQLPPYNEPFDDTEGRFPMLEQMEQDLRNNYYCDTSILWFAQVVPEKEEDRDIEHLPMLAEAERFLQSSDDVGSMYWFAEVLPEKDEGGEGARSEYLALGFGGPDSMKLVRMFFTTSLRYIGTLEAGTLEG